MGENRLDQVSCSEVESTIIISMSEYGRVVRAIFHIHSASFETVLSGMCPLVGFIPRFRLRYLSRSSQTAAFSGWIDSMLYLWNGVTSF